MIPQSPYRIVVTPPFPHLQRFKQGWWFKQWTGDNSKVLMKASTISLVLWFTVNTLQVFIPAIVEYVPPQVVTCLSVFLDFCYLVRHSEFGQSDLIAIEKALNKFHSAQEIFCTSGVCRKGFNLPHQHSMVHYVHPIQEFGAPNGLCSSITESCHITTVKKPWHHSNHYEPLGQNLLTNQRLDKLAAARAHFIAHGMLPEVQMMATTPKPVRNERDDGAIDGDILREIALPLHPHKRIPSLTSHMKLISESRIWFPHRYRVASRTP